jgi:hypothetical protein
MRLSEFIGSEVRDGNGRRVGRVVDVRVVRHTAPDDGSFGVFAVDAIVVAGRGPMRAWRPDQRGPVLLKLLDRWAERRRRSIPWTAVESTGPGIVSVRLSSP